jgi:outer membrane immunogenic protein
MKKLLLGAVVCIAFAASAFAADVPPRTYTKAPADTAPEAVYNWTGVYVGGYAGGALGGLDRLQRSNGQFFGGVQAGFDRQFAPNWVSGAEVEFGGLVGKGGNGVLFPTGTLVTGKLNGLGSVTGRIGYMWGPALLYAKGGYAVRDNTDISASAGGVPVVVTTSSHQRSGIAVGGGLEYMFAPNWSAKAEYLYYTFGDSTVTGGPAAIVGTRFRDDEHTVKLGINYRFGSGPIVARQ